MTLPRMADFAIRAVAVAPALGWTGDDFLSHYAAVRRSAHDLAIEAAPVASVVIALAEAVAAWTGTAAELLGELDTRASDQAQKQRTWPCSPRALSGILRRLAPDLRAAGVGIDFDVRRPGGSRERLIHLYQQDEADGQS